MKHRIHNWTKVCILAGFLIILSVPAHKLPAQTQEQLSSYLKRHPDADADSDGILTREEAHQHRRNDPSRGDNLASVSEIPPADVSLDESPVQVIELRSPDGINLDFALRKPTSEKLLPVIVFFHGGGGQSNLEGLKKNLINGAVQTRLLEKGYATVQSTRRPYWVRKGIDESTGFYDAVGDAARVVEKVKTLAGIDPEKVVVYGGSGGGILAIVTASEADVAAVVAGEPATVVPLDPRKGKSAGPSEYRDVMENPQAFYKGERKKEMLAWMDKIDAPVLILQGNRTGLYKTNFEILIPELKRLGKEISYREYPGLSHGFYWGTRKTGATLQTVEKIVEQVDAFIQSHTQ